MFVLLCAFLNVVGTGRVFPQKEDLISFDIKQYDFLNSQRTKEDLEEDKDEGASVEDNSSMPDDMEVSLASNREVVEREENDGEAVEREDNNGEAVEREDINREAIEREDNKLVAVEREDNNGKAVEREDNNGKAVEREDNNEAVVEREDNKGETVGDREEENEVNKYLKYSLTLDTIVSCEIGNKIKCSITLCKTSFIICPEGLSFKTKR